MPPKKNRESRPFATFFVSTFAHSPRMSPGHFLHEPKAQKGEGVKRSATQRILHILYGQYF